MASRVSSPRRRHAVPLGLGLRVHVRAATCCGRFALPFPVSPLLHRRFQSCRILTTRGDCCGSSPTLWPTAPRPSSVSGTDDCFGGGSAQIKPRACCRGARSVLLPCFMRSHSRRRQTARPERPFLWPTIAHVGPRSRCGARCERRIAPRKAATRGHTAAHGARCQSGRRAGPNGVHVHRYSRKTTTFGGRGNSRAIKDSFFHLSELFLTHERETS